MLSTSVDQAKPATQKAASALDQYGSALLHRYHTSAKVGVQIGRTPDSCLSSFCLGMLKRMPIALPPGSRGIPELKGPPISGPTEGRLAAICWRYEDFFTDLRPLIYVRSTEQYAEGRRLEGRS